MKKLVILIAIAIIGGLQIGFAQKKQSSTYNFERAKELVQQKGNPEEILELLDRQLKETPKYADALFLRAGIYATQKNFDRALADVNRAIACYKRKNADYSKSCLYSFRAYVYAEYLDEPDKALADYNTAYELVDKDNLEERNSLLFDRAQIHYDKKDFEAADADYRQMLKNNEADQAAMIGIIRNRIAREEYDEALKLADKCEKYNADYEETYRFRMQIYDKMGETDKAIDDVVVYFDKSDNPQHYLLKSIMGKHLSYALAKVQAQLRKDNDYSWKQLRIHIYKWGCDYANAIRCYDQLEQEYGASATIYHNRSECYNEIGDTDRAVADITRAIEMNDGEDYYDVVTRGGYYREGGQYPEAIDDFTRGIELEPTEAYAYYQRGWCYELSGDDDKAMEDYNAGIDVDKTYPYIFLMRGELYRKRGDMERANADFEEVLKQDTVAESGSCRHYALHFLGQEENAFAWMEQIIESEPNNSGCHYDKACLLARMGHLSESLEALRKAFEKGFRSFAHIEHDDDMDALREMPEFTTLIEEYKAEPINIIEEDVQADKSETISEIQIRKMYSGVYEVPCTINELPLKFIFDTGASTVSISSVEASFMLKNGYLKPEDIKGKEYYSTATGEIHEGTTIRLREIKIGNSVLRNVEASVTHSQQAPLLLGQSVLERFGTITVDNINSKLIIKQK